MDLTNRELASLLLLVGFFAVMLIRPKTRSTILPSFRQVIRALLVWKVLVVFAVYFGYTAGVVALGAHAGIWSFDLLKDTVITTLFVGLPLVLNAGKTSSGSSLVRKVLIETLGVSAFLAFYFNLASLPLWGELLLQPLLLLLSFSSLVSKRDPKTRLVGKICDALLAILGFGLLAFTTVKVVTTWSALDLSEIWLSFALSVWLPVGLLPLIYILAILMSAETVLVLLPWHNNKVAPPLRVRFAFVFGTRLSAFYASHFAGQWLGRLAKQTTFREGLRVVADYRRDVRNNVTAEKGRLDRLRSMSGIDGTDENGLQRDRREFAATKKVLKRLFYYQMGQNRNLLGHYRHDILLILGDVTSDGLPAEHGIEVRVSADKKQWYGWRRTITGWYFGIGGDETLDAEWQFDGPGAPMSFPTKGSDWTDATSSPSRPEWLAADDPIRVV
ncbi:hypothetical protein [Subtercola boreus]|uniref:Uncharacterized protein n=1 Tax=Subtercola boreus TaxID=120213 RepID=A0A3E0W5B7_9MICO|nr:hypothetical protein [Subtercola boreus]RFA17663.1 hypothetical protein B7R23_16955 [Subtercola boreus]RFA17667.1 hypothetical protein B7R24_16745 [Subtercola boreus]RFA24183.1 hypothetical protein B7R25_17325 [Subtercola boreus]